MALLLVDEAARVSDDLYMAVRPMMAVSGGMWWLMSTPMGKRGLFYEAWANGGPEWGAITRADDGMRANSESIFGRRSGQRWASAGSGRSTIKKLACKIGARV